MRAITKSIKKNFIWSLMKYSKIKTDKIKINYNCYSMRSYLKRSVI